MAGERIYDTAITFEKEAIAASLFSEKRVSLLVQAFFDVEEALKIFQAEKAETYAVSYEAELLYRKAHILKQLSFLQEDTSSLSRELSKHFTYLQSFLRTTVLLQQDQIAAGDFPLEEYEEAKRVVQQANTLSSALQERSHEAREKLFSNTSMLRSLGEQAYTQSVLLKKKAFFLIRDSLDLMEKSGDWEAFNYYFKLGYLLQALQSLRSIFTDNPSKKVFDRLGKQLTFPRFILEEYYPFLNALKKIMNVFYRRKGQSVPPYECMVLKYFETRGLIEFYKFSRREHSERNKSSYIAVQKDLINRIFDCLDEMACRIKLPQPEMAVEKIFLYYRLWAFKKAVKWVMMSKALDPILFEVASRKYELHDENAHRQMAIDLLHCAQQLKNIEACFRHAPYYSKKLHLFLRRLYGETGYRLYQLYDAEYLGKGDEDAEKKRFYHLTVSCMTLRHDYFQQLFDLCELYTEHHRLFSSVMFALRVMCYWTGRREYLKPFYQKTVDLMDRVYEQAVNIWKDLSPTERFEIRFQYTRWKKMAENENYAPVYIWDRKGNLKRLYEECGRQEEFCELLKQDVRALALDEREGDFITFYKDMIPAEEIDHENTSSEEDDFSDEESVSEYPYITEVRERLALLEDEKKSEQEMTGVERVRQEFFSSRSWPLFFKSEPGRKKLEIITQEMRRIPLTDGLPSGAFLSTLPLTGMRAKPQDEQGSYSPKRGPTI